ncbi:RICIN domain-containing protein [Streptomyces sp. NPDC005728]|uniref:RICIN domain-containing protein n=1 Tax=Streptomyces sp. NPDC005728 TaxID=3157054 RepID=UPI0033F0BB76
MVSISGNVEAGCTYKLVNVKAGSFLDLSGGDHTSIIGNDSHDDDTQKWQVEQDDGWYLRNVGSSTYLGIEVSPGDGTPVIAVDHQYPWDIRPDEEDQGTYRLYVPNTRFVIDLSDHGNPVPGTLVTLWGALNPGKNQCWRFEQV